ncbi:inositol 2-dehydrogenase [Actinomadura rubrobrunea]|uniref:Inositol 2-dehydrogenase n=1 Tax=Actinomadura rubrobrunea TaxID=115335 RepID=A0A9W6Q1R9_9ACTN|nr:Gfo/Idh/MocA family oxidoreductase [Actinomadura rubrobrunea]GLW66951.1 inositol 2-dehydrogenase [Actinomadura rubrobrunea]
MSTLRLGVVGLGVISRFYLKALDRFPDVRLAAVCDLREEALRPFRDTTPCHRDHRAMLEREDLDAIVVNVPNDRHVEICWDAVLSGRAVCVEKPLATRYEDGLELSRHAWAHDTVLFTAFHRRYNDNVLKLQRRLRGKPPIEWMRVRYLERIEEHVGDDRWYLDPERCGGGCVADNGPNAFDLVRMFLGDVELESAEIQRDDQGVDRQALITLRASSGASATVELDWSYPNGEAKDVEVRLADGTVLSADMLDGFPVFKSSLEHEYVGVLDDFVRRVRAGDASDDGGLAALRLVHACYSAERAASAAQAAAATPAAPERS